MSEAADSTSIRGGRFWLAMAGLFTLIGLLNFGIARTSALAEGSSWPAKFPLLYELTAAYTMLLLLPGVLWLAQRYPVEGEGRWRRLLLHLAASVPFGVTHTLLMWGSRTVAFRLLGWGEYDYGDMRYRFPMEYQKQVLAYGGIVAVAQVIRHVRRSHEREMRTAELERRLTEARLDALKMQLNPHFLFNSLNMISSHIHDDPDRADTMLDHLADFLRQTLRHSGRQEVRLADDLVFLDDYLAIMRARFGDRLDVEVRVADGCEDALVPHLLLQPLVENAVAHCMDDHHRPGRIRVEASRQDETVRLRVEDNGPGLSGKPEEALQKGVGLSNTAARLRELYGEEQRLELLNRPEGGLRVAIKIPWRIESTRETA